MNRLGTGVEEFTKDARDFGSAHGFCVSTDKLGAYRNYIAKQKQERPRVKVAALVLHDAVGLVQELNAARLAQVEKLNAYTSRLDIVRRQQVSNSILGLKALIKQNALSARASEPDIVEHKRHTRRGPVTYTTTREERATQDATKTWKDMNPEAFYDEAARKRFASQYEQKVKAFQEKIEVLDKDYTAWAGQLDWITLIEDDYDASSINSRISLIQMAAPCLSGGPATRVTDALWKKWLTSAPMDKDNPVYKALFGGQKSIVQYLTPDKADSKKTGERPDANKTDELYDVVSGLAGSEESKKYSKALLLAAVGHLQMALGGAATRLGTQLNRVAEDTVLRAQQAALKLYAKTEATFLRVSMTVGEYYKLLSDLAFDAKQKVSSTLAKEGGRKVRSLVLGGVLNISNAKVRNTVIQVIIWSLDRVADIERELKTLARGVTNMTASTLRQIKLHSITLGGHTAKVLNRLQGVAVKSVDLAAFAQRHMSRTLRAGGSVGVVLSAGAVYFQGWSFQNSLKDVGTKLGKDKDEAMAALGSAGFGVVGATVSGLGEFMQALSNAWKEIARKIIKFGGLLLAVSSAFDGVASFLAAIRTGSKGDTDAAKLYFASGLSFIGGAIAAGVAAYAGSAALLGPFGIALTLIAIGVLLAWMALKAEDTQMQIWFDRCAFGRGKRTEGKWGDHQFADEMAELNAIIVGLKAELAWEDKIGLDGVQSRLTFPGFDIQHSFYEYTLSVKGNAGYWHKAAGGKYDPKIAHQHTAWEAQDTGRSFAFSPQAVARDTEHKQNIIVVHDFRVDESRYTEAKISVRYLSHLDDPEASAEVTRNEKD